jgi:hypothetical protein
VRVGRRSRSAAGATVGVRLTQTGTLVNERTCLINLNQMASSSSPSGVSCLWSRTNHTSVDRLAADRRQSAPFAVYHVRFAVFSDITPEQNMGVKGSARAQQLGRSWQVERAGVPSACFISKISLVMIVPLGASEVGLSK